MNNRQWIVPLTLATALLTGCASYMKRKECEKTNWFQYGEQVALRGERPDADPLIQECKKVEADIQSAELDRGFKKGMAQYCTKEQAFQTGSEGLRFNEEFCERNEIPALTKKYNEGLAAYCSAKGGQRIGKSGKIYTKICKGESEDAFLTAYNPARKKFLKASIQSLRTQIDDRERKVSQKNARLNQLNRQSSRLHGRLYQNRLVRTKDPETGKISKRWEEVLNPNVQSDLDAVNSETYSVQSDVRKLEKEINDLQKDEQKMLIEHDTL